MKKTHWTQTPEGKKRMSEIMTGRIRAKFKNLARTAVKTKRVKRIEKKSTNLVVNGWRITLAKDMIRIEQE